MTQRSRPDRKVPSVELIAPSGSDAKAFLAGVAASRRLHRGFASPPATKEAFTAYVARQKDPRHVGRLIVDRASGELAGVVNMNEIVRGSFQSAFLGYYAFEAFAGRGYMEAGIRKILRLAFGEVGLHRLEANIQPENERSIALVRRVGFRLEGYAPKYLKIGGRWRDHERFAVTREDLKSR